MGPRDVTLDGDVTRDGDVTLDGGRDQSPSLVSAAKALRLLGMLGEGLAELERVELDEDGKRRVAAAYRSLLVEVASTVSDPLIDELVRLGMSPLDPDATVDETRVAHAQLFGWVNGLVLAEAELGTQGEAPGQPGSDR